MHTHVEPVQTARQMREFIRLPFALYRDDPHFVPPLLSERRRFFSAANPLFEFTEVGYFLARDEHGRVIGRVTGHVNRRHNEFHGEQIGFFGFFECVRDPTVATALLGAAEQWVRARGMTAIRGPFNFSTNEECGFLARGFERPPVIMMTYSPQFYLEFMEPAGYRKVRELLAYEYHSPDRAVPEYLERASRIVRARTGVTVRPFQPARFAAEVATAFRLYNAAWERNWGFVPMTEAEFHYAARELRPLLDPEIALFAEHAGRPIAFSLALPDYNQVLRHMRGRLLPWGWVRFLRGRRHIHHVRVILLGVLPEYRGRGIDTLLYHETFRRGLARGYWSCEMSWILEDNLTMRRALERMGAQVTKVYHIYEKTL